MTPELIDREEFIVIGIRAVLESVESADNAVWKEEFLPRRDELRAEDHRYYAVFNPLSSDKDRMRYEYVAGVASDSLENIPIGMVGWVIPSGTYAEARVVGMRDIRQTCRDIVAEWLPDSGYAMIESPIFAYTDNMQPDAPDAVWKVNIPVATPESLEQLEKWLK